MTVKSRLGHFVVMKVCAINYISSYPTVQCLSFQEEKKTVLSLLGDFGIFFSAKKSKKGRTLFKTLLKIKILLSLITRE